VAAHVGRTAIPPVAGSIDLDWSDDALADLDRFAAFLFQYRYDGNRIVMLRVFHGREAR
jgi:plasmid stabilization system protein ParE